MKYRMLLVLVFISVLLFGCSKDNNSNVENSLTEGKDNTETTADKPIVPDNCSAYGTYASLERCVNVDGTIEYLPTSVPFEYTGEEVRYRCFAGCTYKYDNAYEQESIDCLVMLFFNEQYIPFSVNDSEKMFVHHIKAINKIDDKIGEYDTVFEFSFYPYGLENENTEKFRIIVIPLYPLTMSEGEEKIDWVPIRVCTTSGKVTSKAENCEYIQYFTNVNAKEFIKEDQIPQFNKGFASDLGRAAGPQDFFIFKRKDKLENIVIYEKMEETMDKTIFTIAMCDNNISDIFGVNTMITTDVKESLAIISEIDTSKLDKGKHTIFTLNIVKDNIDDSERVYRSNFVDIVVE